MLVIVGHGPSVIQRSLGSWLDGQTVVRLKEALRPDARHWGTRTDYVCASHPRFLPDIGAEKWVLSEKPVVEKDIRAASEAWFDYFAQFAPAIKPSTGLRAIFCAVEFLQPDEIGLLGFDRLFRPAAPSNKWYHDRPEKYWWAHDSAAEQRAALSLGVKLTEV